MMLSLDKESAKLLRAVIRPSGEATESAIAESISRIHCWKQTIEGARRHGVVPMLYARLAANEQLVPPEALKLARDAFERNALHCMTNAEELLKILRAFDETGIRAMPFKGIVLGASAYGDMTARAAGDLDILIHYDDLMRATSMLQGRGYELKSKVLEDGSPAVEDYFEFPFKRASDGMVLELRWRLELTQSRYRHDLGIDWVWPRRRTAKIAGADVPNLDPVTTLLVLCMHGSKHVWSRLVWVCDVAKLLGSEPGLDWDLAQREAKQVGLWPCLALGVLLARRLIGCEVPSDVLRRFESNRTMRKLAEFFDENLLEEPGKMPEGWIPYNLKVLGIRDQVGVVLSPAFLRPNARDRALVKLPKALEPLYYVIRPFRVLLDRTGR
ncbi:MAG TPA: nucleotidyltransferase family protein [Terracidiphilus sp.]|jgi:hypothetical protein